ncbi:hypothetical protein [Roseibium sp.]|uniref:hypothetical protein n=1 Tax=Roseibium sp. TaxID=1936156 RepID=UPI003B51210D
MKSKLPGHSDELHVIDGYVSVDQFYSSLAKREITISEVVEENIKLTLEIEKKDRMIEQAAHEIAILIKINEDKNAAREYEERSTDELHEFLDAQAERIAELEKDLDEIRNQNKKLNVELGKIYTRNNEVEKQLRAFESNRVLSILY